MKYLESDVMWYKIVLYLINSARVQVFVSLPPAEHSVPDVSKMCYVQKQSRLSSCYIHTGII